LVERKAVGALSRHVLAQRFVLRGLADRVNADVILESREVNQVAAIFVIRHPVAQALLGFGRRLLDQLAELAKARLRRLRRSRYVRIDSFHAGFSHRLWCKCGRSRPPSWCHFPVFILSSSSPSRSIDSLAPSSMPEATIPSRSITDSKTW